MDNLKLGQPDSPYGIICRTCGDVPLSPREYDRQMMKPDNLWTCPICDEEAIWNDDRYEKMFLEKEE